jgi:putative Mg2+ transporter-C (MgtC) family protein
VETLAMSALWNDPRVQILVSLLMAFVLGGIVGYERQYRQRTAGLRTNVLVAVGAALFVNMADRLDGHGGSVRVISYVVSGIGFLGAGVIMREEGNVRGINTAATLWGSAAIGAACGAMLFFEASLGAMFVLAANTLLRPLVNAMNRQPLDTEAVEATYTVYVIAAKEDRQNTLERVAQMLESAGYPIRELQQHPFGQGEVEIEATLMATSVDGDALDALVEGLSTLPQVHQAFWSPRTSE